MANAKKCDRCKTFYDPFLYSNVVEEDKCYCITDKEMIENIKTSTGFIEG